MMAGVSLPYVPSLATSRAADYLRLARPRLAALVLATVAAGWLLAAGRGQDPLSLLHALVGTALLFAGSSAFNQLLERHADALMPRTADRPLPSGRLRPAEVLASAAVLSAGGLAYLLAARQPLPAALGAVALVSYVGLYGPLKRLTPLSTLVGAVPGAVPPLIGWAAARGRLDAGALALFLIVFLWQVPHFLAIAWIYRDQYARAGFRVLATVDPHGVRTGRQMVRYTAALAVAGVVPFTLGLVGWPSAVAALALGGVFLLRAVGFARGATTAQARGVLRASLLFLPVLFLVFVLDALLLGGR
jgi:protoheme IX farnesyltransferase